MCGVFGFISANDNQFGPDIKALCEVAKYNDSRRGGHAWGVSWIDQHGRLRCHKQPGRLKPEILAGLVEEAVVLIGHLRFTTQGTEKINSNNHPHPCDGGWMVHNGVLPEYNDIRESFSTEPLSDCDSEMLAIAWTDAPSDEPAKRADWMLRTCQPGWYSPLVVLGLWQKQLVAIRQGNPLHTYSNKDGVYLSSLAVPGLEKFGQLKPVLDESITTWKQGKKGWKKSFSRLEQRDGIVRPMRQRALPQANSLPW